MFGRINFNLGRRLCTPDTCICRWRNFQSTTSAEFVCSVVNFIDTCDFVFVADGLHTCIVQLANGTDFKCKQPAALWSSNQENPNLAATLHAVKRYKATKQDSFSTFRGLPAPLIPHLTYLSQLRDCGVFRTNDTSIFTGSASASELSMHANAIALKYLSDEQLSKIAANTTATTSGSCRATPQVCLRQVLFTSPINLWQFDHFFKYVRDEGEKPLLGWHSRKLLTEKFQKLLCDCRSCTHH